MEDEPNFNKNNNEKSETPQYDNNIFEFKGELLSINTDIINIVLNELNIRFKLEDFDQYETEKQVLDYFYHKEKSSLESIDLNFKDNETQKEFLKSFVSEMIEDKYKYNVSLTKMRNIIDMGIIEIIEEIRKCKDITSFNLTEKYMQKFKTDKIPIFLEKNIIGEIDVLLLMNEFNVKSEKKNLCEKSKGNQEEYFMIYFSQILNKESTPFEGGNHEVLFEILLYSNLKDIYKFPRMKQFFIDNCFEISKRLNYLEGIQKLDEEINNRKEFKYIEDNLKKTFKKYEMNDFHSFIIASYIYFLIIHLKDMSIKEKENPKCIFNKNNLNNPLILRILKNILICFAKYCPHPKYTLETYMSLLNYFSKCLIKEEGKEKNNKQYNANDIEEKIKYSKNYNYIEVLDVSRELIKNAEKTNSLSKKLLNNYITLIPLTKKRTSHTITILISGFLSQKDDIDTWKGFLNFDKENTDYYWFRWPSSDILSFVIQVIANIKKSLDSFKWCYLKAEYVGKILALFLLNNDEFNDCQINLVGFSLGCHVLANVLKELNKHKNKGFMINNVLFMGGATVIEDSEKDLWRDIFGDNVAGRIINCYSNFDGVLSYLFVADMRKIPIGIGRIDIQDENKEYSLVENYDFSNIKLGHLNYRQKFEIILERIKFFNWHE